MVGSKDGDGYPLFSMGVSLQLLSVIFWRQAGGNRGADFSEGYHI